jgi:hypothetical protein
MGDVKAAILVSCAMALRFGMMLWRLMLPASRPYHIRFQDAARRKSNCCQAKTLEA